MQAKRALVKRLACKLEGIITQMNKGLVWGLKREILKVNTAGAGRFTYNKDILPVE